MAKQGNDNPPKRGQESPEAGSRVLGPPRRHYIAELLKELEDIPPDQLRGGSRFPAPYELRFAPAQFRSIVAITQKLLTHWDRLSPDLSSHVERALGDLLEISAQIGARPTLPQGQMGAEDRKAAEGFKLRLTPIMDFFSEVIEPMVDSPADQSSRPNQGLSDEELAEVRRVREELEQSRNELAQLKAQNAEVSAELAARNDLVEATRTETGSEGAVDLARAYSDQAEHHDLQWKIWGVALLVASIAALAGGYFLLKSNHPADHATAAQIVSHVAEDLLVVGLLIYVVRVTSLQFSVHRHLSAVANNKAAALTTFARIVSSGSSAETAIALPKFSRTTYSFPTAPASWTRAQTRSRFLRGSRRPSLSASAARPSSAGPSWLARPTALACLRPSGVVKVAFAGLSPGATPDRAGLAVPSQLKT